MYYLFFESDELRNNGIQQETNRAKKEQNNIILNTSQTTLCHIARRPKPF